MFGRLFLLFTLVPLVELVLLIRIGEWIGALPTVGLVLVTGVVGASLARREGVRTWGRVRGELSAGRVPGVELLHALMVVVAGAFLVTPGVLTDLAGLGLLVRPIRNAVIGRLRRSLEARVEEGSVHIFGFTPDRSGPGGLDADRFRTGPSFGGREGPSEGREGPEPPEGPDGWYRREEPVESDT